MIDLKSIKKGKEVTPPKILIYGVEGVGKSTAAASWPSAIVTQTEDRLAHISVDKFPLVSSFEEAMETLRVLYKEKHSYKTHVTDSVDWLEHLVHAKVCREAGEEAIVSNKKGSDLTFGRGYVLAAKLMQKYLDALNTLRTQKGMTIVLVGHSVVKTFEDPLRENYDRYELSVDKKVKAIIKQWVDCAFFASYEVFLRTEEKGFGGKDKKALGSGKRIVYTEERPGFDAKNSYDLPFELPMIGADKGGLFSVFDKHYKKWCSE